MLPLRDLLNPIWYQGSAVDLETESPFMLVWSGQPVEIRTSQISVSQNLATCGY